MEHRAHVPTGAHQLLVVNHVEDGEADGAGHRVAPERGEVHSQLARDLGRRDDGPNRVACANSQKK